jgi:hypothetical protein
MVWPITGAECHVRETDVELHLKAGDGLRSNVEVNEPVDPGTVNNILYR